MKTVFIISGFDIHRTATDPKHRELRERLSNKGYKVIPVPITWHRKTPSQYVTEFINFYNKNKGDYNILIGNSFGAIIAVLSAPKINPQKIYLCSLSPFFKEDKHFKPDSYFIKYFGRRRLSELRSISFTDIANQINKLTIATTIAHGDKEYETSPPLVKRCEDAAEKIKNAKLYVFKNTPHNMSDPNYVNELLKLF